MADISNCHQAPLKAITGDEGTSYWICTECKQPADPFIEGSYKHLPDAEEESQRAMMPDKQDIECDIKDGV